LWRSANPERTVVGFTLIEALAALGVVAVGLTAIGALANSSLRAGLHTQRHLTDIESVRRIVTGLPSRDALPFGRLAGTLDGYEWRIDSTPLPTSDRVGSSWTPQRVVLLVRSPYGAVIEIDTIRLHKQAEQ
jgi:general secretion pathway protein I